MRFCARLCLAFVCLAGPAEAMGPVYPFRSLAAADGLPHSFVYSISQDRWGYLWVATSGGAARYDGQHFTTWSLKNGLPGNDVRAVHQDRRGRIWMALHGGIARLEPDAAGEIDPGAAIRVFTPSDGLPAAFAIGLLEDTAGRLWAITRDGGLSRLGETGVEQTLRSGKELPQETLWCGEADPSGGLWLGTRGAGVVRLTSDGTVSTIRDGLPDPNVFDLKLSPDGILYAATSGGVARLDATAGRFEAVRYGPDWNAPASSLTFGEAGTLWVGRYGRGLAKITAAGSTVFLEDQGLPSSLLTGLFVDREGTLWIATQGAGIVRFSSDRVAAYDRSSGWPGGVTSSFAEGPDGTIYIGSFGKGVVTLRPDGTLGSIAAASDGLADDLIRSLLVTRDGTLLVGTSSGLSYRRRGESRFQLRKEVGAGYVHSLCEGHDGTLWVGTARGLTALSPGGGVRSWRRADGLLEDEVESISEGQDGKIYVGTGRGVSVFDGKAFESLTMSNGLPPGRIFATLAAPGGTLWFGGDGGVTSWKPGSPPEYRRYGLADGLPSLPVSALLITRSGVVWAGTARGAAHLVGGEFKAHGGRETVLSEEVYRRASFLDSKGRIWWGTPGGPIVYSPSNDRANPVPPTVRIVDATAGTQTWRARPTLQLPIGASTVVFRYTSLSFVDPEHTAFKTRLVGFDPDWSRPTTAREVRYTNLPTGSYELQVLAANNDGVWSTQPATMRIELPTPWWRTPWAIALAVLVLSLLAYAIHETRLAALKARAVELESQVTERTAELARREQAKTESVAVVSHELRSPLTSIIGSLALLTSEEPPDAETSRQLLKMANANAERLLRLINGLLDIEKLESGRMELMVRRQPLAPLIEATVQSNESYAQRFGVTLELVKPVPELRVEVDSDRFVQIVTNLVSNAVKYSPAGGVVTIRAERAADLARIGVTDRGPGVPESFRSRIFEKFAQADTGDGRRPGGTGLGLNISRALAERMGGRLRFETETGKGSTFYLELPLARSSSTVLKALSG